MDKRNRLSTSLARLYHGTQKSNVFAVLLWVAVVGPKVRGLAKLGCILPRSLADLLYFTLLYLEMTSVNGIMIYGKASLRVYIW
jgi:hypothetical protein